MASTSRSRLFAWKACSSRRRLTYSAGHEHDTAQYITSCTHSCRVPNTPGIRIMGQQAGGGSYENDHVVWWLVWLCVHTVSMRSR
jgi:hypothetical protein